MYTTLSPCVMCSATCVLYRIPRVVLGENATFVGGEELLQASGVEVVNLDDGPCKEMMQGWTRGAGKEVWWEDIGLTGEGEAGG
jgi:creatinine deaminase